MQQQKAIASNAMMRIQHQNRSDPSSSDDGMPQPISHRVATGIHLAHNKTIAPAGLISETIEMKNLSSPPSSVSSFDIKPQNKIRHFGCDLMLFVLLYV